MQIATMQNNHSRRKRRRFENIQAKMFKCFLAKLSCAYLSAELSSELSGELWNKKYVFERFIGQIFLFLLGCLIKSYQDFLDYLINLTNSQLAKLTNSQLANLV